MPELRPSLRFIPFELNSPVWLPAVKARHWMSVPEKRFRFSRDCQRTLPGPGGELDMEKDTICRIYSMSKIITTIATPILFEEGRISLDDPIGNYFAEKKNPKVMTGGTADNPTLVDAGPLRSSIY